MPEPKDDLIAALHKLGGHLDSLAQAIEHQAAAVAALVEEIAAQAADEPEPDDSSPTPMGGAGRIHRR